MAARILSLARTAWSGLLLACLVPASAPHAATISGFVTDAANGEALQYANVLLKGTSLGGITNAKGFYTIAGFSGHGFQHSPAAGRILADVIAGIDPRFDLAPFELDRFARRSTAGEANVV